MTLFYAMFLTPVGLIAQLRSKTIIAIPLCLLAIGLQSGLGDEILFQEYTLGGVLCNAMTLVLLSLAFAIRQTNVYKELRDNLKERPWCTKETCAVSNDAISATVCPFSGLGASMRCPNCYTCVSSPAYHFEDRFHAYGKQYVINWERAKDVMMTSKDPTIGRQLLDEVLDYRCNPYFGTVTDCCVGCALSDRNYFALDMLLVMTSVYSLILASIPYVLPAYVNAKGILMFLSCASIFLASCSILITTKILCTSLYFCKIFPDLKFRYQVDMEDHWFLRKLVAFMLGRKGAVAVSNNSLQNQIHNEKAKFVSLAAKLKALR
ncbi:hypothetical protein HOP50_04g30640 [Chloropicon primus]|uniref:Uncharacterized protein n=1 Tax=Chloropicon primus TaxID=1764295 RepID=A0A5B8MJ96_9CHLO|nr:hypothetical protein A3770_04p30610 [Chloropicon primus]UPQ99755.1 hypothetical protein HOP50_04g30640 [Chloropicon primus]|mmetsp:Transcript_4959/g.14843  ORF Transcript_4959/g.14843 Transcript_4959/m.14843 type:complete len:321 (-) Transcript_4959:1113-2075(-)|eukprot:QDZ20543.1 hypothetical protein A3770_04p30610 [Chloropicon primus]